MLEKLFYPGNIYATYVHQHTWKFGSTFKDNFEKVTQKIEFSQCIIERRKTARWNSDISALKPFITVCVY